MKILIERKLLSILLIVATICAFSWVKLDKNDNVAKAATYGSIGEIRCLADSTAVTLNNQTVTAVFPDYSLYIGNMFAGMKVMLPVGAPAFVVGDTINLTGTMKTLSTNGYRVERLIKVSSASNIVKVGTASSIYRKNIVPNAVGGGAFCPTGSPGAIIATKDFGANAIGLNTIGMLVYMTATVTYADPNSDIFYIDTSSAGTLLNYPTDPQRYGIMVSYTQNVGNAFKKGDGVVITGINQSHFITAWNASNRFIQMRSPSDLTVAFVAP